MTFGNAVNASNTDFQLSTGTLQRANRLFWDPGFTENLAVTYSGGTFTVCGGDGTALSATNPAYVTLQSKTAGLFKRYTLTANQTFTDGSSGSIDNMRWGVTTGVNWAQDMPFYIYAVADDSEATLAFMISRIPHRNVSPATASIGKSGSVVNVGQGDFYSLLSITTSNYDVNPCLCLGSFRMQFAGATDSYTVQALATTDGIGQFNDTTIWNFPVGQNGNSSTGFFAANGGTAPVWSTQTAVYRMDRRGNVSYIFDNGTSTPSTNGVGAVTLTQNLPLSYASNSLLTAGFQFLNGAASITSIGRIATFTAASPTIAGFLVWNTLSNAGQLQNQDCATSARINAEVFSYVASLTT